MLEGKQDGASVTRNHKLLRRYPDGVTVHDVANIVTRNGLTTEIWRADWNTAPAPPQQAIFITLRPGVVSAWHRHARQLDQLFVVGGAVKLVLFDPRDGSSTRGQVFELFLDRARPCLVTVPPSIWHGFQPLGNEPVSIVNFFSAMYDHADPDEFRMPLDSPDIPYRFA